MSNLLFITVDDLFSLSAWPLYDDIAQTPNLDALAARSLNFEAAFADVALCNPSRAAILTGQTPWQTGVLSNGQQLSHHVDLATQTLPGILKSSGYHVTTGGKIFHKLHDSDRDLVAHDFVEKVGLRNTTSDIYDNVGRTFYGPTEEPLADTDLVGKAVDILAGLDGVDPQALFFGIYRPHVDWVIPQEFIDLYDGIDIPVPDFVDETDRAAFAQSFANGPFHAEVLSENAWEALVLHYLASVSYADALVGELLAALETSAIAENTVVMVMSDHGYHLGDGANWHKFTTHEQSARAPLMIATPEGTARAIDTPVNLSSVAATALELLDLAPGAEMAPSLVPLALGTAEELPPAITWMNGSFSLRTQDYRYTRYENGEEDLFHIPTDIYAETNLMDARPNVRAAMRTMADEIMDDIIIRPDGPAAGDASDTVFYMVGGQVEISDDGGRDTVVTHQDYTLPMGIENLMVLRQRGPVDFTGNDLDNRISSGGTNDTIVGHDGDDSIFSNNGHDHIDAGAGHDRIDTSSGNDTVHMGPGDDTLIAGHGNDVATGGTGHDIVYGDAGQDTMHGEVGNDTLIGNVGDDFMTGGLGHDLFEDGLGNDSMSGGPGDDLWRMGDGRDSFDGGAGRDRLEMDLSGQTPQSHVVDVHLAAGYQSVLGSSWRDLLVSVEDVRLFGDFDAVVTGNASANEIRTDLGNDLIKGGAGRDSLDGGDGADTILGGVHGDSVTGGAGDDLLKGGLGPDILSGGTGADSLRGQRNDDALHGMAGPDNLKGGGGSDTLLGGDAHDFLNGGSGADSLDGGAGRDMLIGRSLADTLIGGAGHDRLNAGGADDRLEGGTGRDALKGGAGADVFVLGLGFGRDRVLDFDMSADRLEITAALAAGRDATLIAALAEQTDGGVTLDFGNGDELRLLDLDSILGLGGQIDVV